MGFQHIGLFLSYFLSIAVAQNDSLPKPFSFSNSQIWDGNDGKWSSFIVRVGTPEQSFRVFPASRHGETIIPIVDGCRKIDPPNCGNLRGAYAFQGKDSNGFLVNETKTWHEIGLYGMGIRPEIGFDANALYGLDSVGLQVANSGGPTLDNMVVAGVAKPTVYVGQFGLSPKPSNFSELDNPQPSYIQTLKDKNQIPSVSYGYTAGAYYKTPKVHGSLTLGGYDASRFVANDITFPFDADDDRPTSLTIQSITAQNTLERTVTLLRDPTYVWIDSTVPHMWLPEDVCDRFEKAFGLTYDNMTDLYIINETMHNQMLDLDPSVTISLGESSDPTKRVNIVLPYGAFDVQASYPYYKDAVNYFPLRRGKNETQYTLGRTVLQEMYIIADYSRGNFSVHQALFPGTNDEQQIMPIYVPGEEPKSNSTSNSTSEATPSSTAGTKHAISGGAIGGIVVGSIAGVGLVGFLAFFILRRRRNQHQVVPSKTNSEHEMEIERGDMHSSHGNDLPPNVFPKYEMPVPDQSGYPTQHGHENSPPGYASTQEKMMHASELSGGGKIPEMDSLSQRYELEPQQMVYEMGSEDARSTKSATEGRRP
ncbi:hypothetical protein N0V90_003455 [Kalmusia sp. IMI 367209]|nr:hypothetical protein N0V90_003455 [Kalmusia sp. IMI 367209]